MCYIYNEFNLDFKVMNNRHTVSEAKKMIDWCLQIHLTSVFLYVPVVSDTDSVVNM